MIQRALGVLPGFIIGGYNLNNVRYARWLGVDSNYREETGASTESEKGN